MKGKRDNVISITYLLNGLKLSGMWLTFYNDRACCTGSRLRILWSLWCRSGSRLSPESGPGFDFLHKCGSELGSCSSSMWWDSATTGLQTLQQGVILSRHGSTASVHPPPPFWASNDPEFWLQCRSRIRILIQLFTLMQIWIRTRIRNPAAELKTLQSTVV